MKTIATIRILKYIFIELFIIGRFALRASSAKKLILKNVEIRKYDYSFERTGIQDTKNKKTYLHEINVNLYKT